MVLLAPQRTRAPWEQWISASGISTSLQLTMSTPPQKALVESTGLEPFREQRRGSDRKVQGVGMEPRYEGQQGRERLGIILGGAILGRGIILQTATDMALNGLRTLRCPTTQTSWEDLFGIQKHPAPRVHTVRLKGRVVPSAGATEKNKTFADVAPLELQRRRQALGRLWVCSLLE